MRMNLGEFLGSDSNPGSESAGYIYHLQTSTPHLYDVSISGLHQSLEMLFDQAMRNLGDGCAHGRQGLPDLIDEEGRVKDFERYTTPINGDPNKTKTVHVIKRHNRTIAARLPGPTWSIIASEITADVLDTHPHPEYAPLKSMQVCSTFGEEAPAVEAARQVAKDMAKEVRGRRFHEMPGPADPGTVYSAVVYDGLAFGKGYTCVVNARFDDGQISRNSGTLYSIGEQDLIAAT